jgi:putative oxidoreductase
MDFTALGLLIMRIAFGGSIAINHGLPKLLNFSNSMANFPDPLGIGSTLSLSLTVFAEFLCGILVALGILTRLSVIPLVVAMATAFFAVHAGDPFAKKELAFLFLAAFSAILVAGPGRFSADSLFRGIK